MNATKVFIHERLIEGCQVGWAERDTMAPHEVRHECTRGKHDTYRPHFCSCGLVEDAA